MPSERLGSVTVPSGIVLDIDTGLTNLWSGDRTPTMPDGPLTFAPLRSSSSALADLGDADRIRDHRRRWCTLLWLHDQLG